MVTFIVKKAKVSIRYNCMTIYSLIHFKQLITDISNDYNKKLKLKNKIISLCLFSIIITSSTLVFGQPEENSTELFNEGMKMEQANNFPQALSYFDKILENDPNNVKALIEKGYVLNSLGNETGALDNFNKALQIDPNNTKALVNKGIILTSLGNGSAALEYINKTLEIDPNNVRALTDSSIILAQQHKYSDALKTINKALSIDPTNVDAIHDRISIYNSIGYIYITAQSNFTLFLQAEIQNSDGQMVAYIESPQSLLQVLNDTTIVNHILDSQNATRTIIKDGKKYDVIQLRQFVGFNNTGFNGVARLVLNDTTPVQVFLGQLHGYTFEPGDVLTQLWTITRLHH